MTETVPYQQGECYGSQGHREYGLAHSHATEQDVSRTSIVLRSHVADPSSQRILASLPAQSPSSTVETADQSATTRTTRSGRVVGRVETRVAAAAAAAAAASSHDRSKVTKSPQTKKNSRLSKKEKPKTPQLTAPLSELTKAFKAIPIRDMEAWVNRPAEVRWKEVEKRNGYIARPMNSFMLYRSAFAERTKQWCTQNNHQVVSSVSGESWPMESAEVRNRYNEYARIERENHQHAHPGYKFSPSKPNNASKKRKPANAEVEASETSELDGLEYDWHDADGVFHAANGSRRPARAGPATDGDALAVDPRPRPFPSGVGAHQSSYEATNPGKPAPSVMEPHDLYGYYYQTEVYPNVDAPFIEDVRMQKTEVPEPSLGEYHGLVGLPGAGHHDLYRQGDLAVVPDDEHLVDPMLLTSMNGLGPASASAHAGHHHDLALHGLPPDYADEAGFGPTIEELRASYPHGLGPGGYGDVPHAPELQANAHGTSGLHDQWSAGFDMGTEFEKWYNNDER